MIGQGRPNLDGPAAWATAARWIPALLLIAPMLSPARAAEVADPVALRLLVTWNAQRPRAWQGTLELDEGQLDDLGFVGPSPTAQAEVWIDGRQAVIEQTEAQTSGGFWVTVTGPRTAQLTLRLAGLDSGSEPSSVDLERLESGSWQTPCAQGGRIEIRRASGDWLQVTLPRPGLVYQTGEKLDLSVQPSRSWSGGEQRLRIVAELRGPGSQRARWSEARELPLDPAAGYGPAELSVPLPRDEGVYELTIAAQVRRLARRQNLAERKLSIVVVDPRRPSLERTIDEVDRVIEIDPASPQLWDRVAHLPLRPGRRRLPTGGGATRVNKQDGQTIVEIDPGDSSGAAWEAYPLSVDGPGRPHLVEVELPDASARDLVMAVVEPAADPAGLAILIGHSSARAATEPGTPPAGRLEFWPRTKSPLLVLANTDPERPARIGKIRLRPGAAPAIAAPTPPIGGHAHRRLLAYFDQADVWARLAGGATGDSPRLDWQSALDGGRRWMIYFRQAGYDGAVIPVASEGGVLYPSQVLGSSTRWDDESLRAEPSDPAPKDTLELLLRLADREGVTLVPALDFAFPLAQLESLRRAENSAETGLEPVGPDGATWRRRFPPRDGRSVYYNPLDPRVQEVMLAALAELVERCAGHASFGGCALRLSGHGFAQLPPANWCLDDATIARFEAATGLSLGAGDDDPARFHERAARVEGDLRPAWQAWRAAELEAFHRRMGDLVRHAGGQQQFWLVGHDLLDSPPLERLLTPALPRKHTTENVLRQIGFDPLEFQAQRSPQLARLWQSTIGLPLERAAVGIQVGQLTGWDRLSRESENPTALLARLPRSVELAQWSLSTDRADATGTLRCEPWPLGAEARRPLVHALAASDVHTAFDGLRLAPALPDRELADVIAAYRGLPAVPFRDLEDAPQPLVVRTATQHGATWCYLANDSPWPLEVLLPVAFPPGSQVRSLAAERDWKLPQPLASGTWQISLRPYDLVALEFSDGRVRFGPPKFELPSDATAALEQRVKELGQRANQLEATPPEDLGFNGGFELPWSPEDAAPGWKLSGGSEVQWRLETEQAHGGQQALSVASRAPRAALVSQPLELPPTGRCSVLVWLRCPQPDLQPTLRIALTAQLGGGQNYYRYATIGSGGRHALSSQWEPFRFHVDNLPLTGLKQPRIQVEMLGPGEFWIDDVQFSPLYFSEAEQRALQLEIFGAYNDLQKGLWADCQRALDGYWPRMLEQYVPLSPERLARQPQNPLAAPPPPAPDDKPWSLLEGMRKWIPKIY